MRVRVIARGHARPAFESANAPFHGVARRVPFRGVGLEVRVPDPGRNDGHHALPRQLGAQGVDVIGPVRDQAGPRRVRPSSRQGPSLGGRGAGRPSRAGTEGRPCRSARTWIGVRKPRDSPLFLGCARRTCECAHDRAVQQHGGQIRIGLPVGHRRGQTPRSHPSA